MWQRFTVLTRRVIFLAQKAAEDLDFREVAPEHLLLGLIREEDCIAARVLSGMGVKLPDLRQELSHPNPEKPPKKKDTMLASESKSAIDRAYEEARLLDDNYIGTEHLLLGLLRTERASEILSRHGVNLEPAREAVLALEEGRPEPFASPPPAEESPRRYGFFQWMWIWFRGRKE